MRVLTWSGLQIQNGQSNRSLIFFLHIGAYLIGLTNSMVESGSYPLIPRWLLDQTYKFDGRKRVLLLSIHRCLLYWAYNLNGQQVGLYLFSLSGLTLDCQLHFFTHLDLPSIASFSIFIWAYDWLPVQTRLNSFNRFNRLSLLILQSLASIRKAFFFLTFSSLSFLCRFTCCLQLHFQFFSTFFIFFIVPSLPRSCRLFFFFSTNVKCAICKCYDRSH